MQDVTRVVETNGEKHLTAANGRAYTVPTTTIVALAADGSEVTRTTIDGTHPMTRANTRERMARKVQDAGFAWLGRSEASETEKADAVMRAYDDAKTAEARRAINDMVYGGTPKPSTY